MTDSTSKISNWYWACAALFAGLLVLWFVANQQIIEPMYFLYSSPLLLVLLSFAAALRQKQLGQFARGPAICLISSAVLFSAVQISQPYPVAFLAFCFLYAPVSLAGLSWLYGQWQKGRSCETAVL
jgi:hypothetical protein